MKRIIIILSILPILFGFSFSSLFKSDKKEISDPTKITDDEERVKWLKENSEEFKGLLEQYLTDQEKNSSEKKIESILKETDEDYNNQRMEEKNKKTKELKEALDRKLKADGASELKKYKVVNGKMINIAEDEKKKKEENLKKERILRIKAFYKEMNMKEPSDSDVIILLDFFEKDKK